MCEAIQKRRGHLSTLSEFTRPLQFVQIVETGSNSKAADKLNIAKSAVSRRLGLLEDKYAARLILRKPGQWGVTDVGAERYQRALGVVSDKDAIEGGFPKRPIGSRGHCPFRWRMSLDERSWVRF